MQSKIQSIVDFFSFLFFFFFFFFFGGGGVGEV